MDGFKDYKDNPLNWSLGIGQLFSIRIRIHLFFFLWMLVQLLRSVKDEALLVSAVIVVILFVIVLLHELGHCFGARSVGGDAEDILMWPLGGLASVQIPMVPRHHLITAAAGPLVNLIFCILSAMLMTIFSGALTTIPLNPFNLFAVTNRVASWSVIDWLVVFWSVNYLLLLFNLLPMFPLDGGRIFQAIMWKHRGLKDSTLIATFVGMIGAICCGVAGMVTENWLLVGIAVFGFITCMQQRQMLKAGMLQEDHEFGYDFSKGYGGFNDNDKSESKPSWLARRRNAKLAKKAEKQRLQQELLEKEIDRVLQKVHQQGIKSLTNKEKKILQSETERKKHS